MTNLQNLTSKLSEIEDYFRTFVNDYMRIDKIILFIYVLGNFSRSYYSQQQVEWSSKQRLIYGGEQVTVLPKGAQFNLTPESHLPPEGTRKILLPNKCLLAAWLVV
ncbi:Hypothetical protein CINCED_3A005321 [Cinara cedri]|uniref:Uncharacterized protein n=1 Tax=Cinara cedri TaxID=506608 RepID=A0A5E4N8P2_9HEMI|nr:Hypothetical protein CINCED_3A005321 [Cinara cedri]